MRKLRLSIIQTAIEKLRAEAGERWIVHVLPRLFDALGSHSTEVVMLLKFLWQNPDIPNESIPYLVLREAVSISDLERVAALESATPNLSRRGGPSKLCLGGGLRMGAPCPQERSRFALSSAPSTVTRSTGPASPQVVTKAAPSPISHLVVCAELSSVVCLFQAFHVNFIHLKHCLHDPFCFLSIFVLQHLA